MDKEEKAKERNRAYQRKYRAEHLEEVREYNRKYAKSHRKEMRERQREWAKLHPEKSKEYYKKNKERIYEINRKWQKEHSKQYSKLCQASRRRRVEKLRAEGVKNVWAVVTKGEEPRYADNNNQERR